MDSTFDFRNQKISSSSRHRKGGKSMEGSEAVRRTQAEVGAGEAAAFLDDFAKLNDFNAMVRRHYMLQNQADKSGHVQEEGEAAATPTAPLSACGRSKTLAPPQRPSDAAVLHNLDDLANFVWDVANALLCLQGAGTAADQGILCHGNLKPSNILLALAPHSRHGVLLTDYGIPALPASYMDPLAHYGGGGGGRHADADAAPTVPLFVTVEKVRTTPAREGAAAAAGPATQKGSKTKIRALPLFERLQKNANQGARGRRGCVWQSASGTSHRNASCIRRRPSPASSGCGTARRPSAVPPTRTASAPSSTRC
ncbi:hypothetical protein STCU_11735 [Strigomonas culicis]|uniref:Protein kinase domain-containing protein n=1 Tax=Strigomonas culicis TaxID=28005 RepID=S9THL1_9TRYP|nr:hypothetical protein STCU_11735 [Strigomonas culicis]|eukprot:EPY15823.1 hypothetical protein STCU_11735 [Strigomonas culicis]